MVNRWIAVTVAEADSMEFPERVRCALTADEAVEQRFRLRDTTAHSTHWSLHRLSTAPRELAVATGSGVGRDDAR